MKLIDSIYNAKLEVHYNEYSYRNKEGNCIKINLQGKIKCPVLNTAISHQTCSHIMDKDTWPRGIRPSVCEECDCFINMSIKKFQDQKKH